MDNLLTDEEIRDFMDCEPSLCDFFNDCESCNCDYKQFYRWVHQKDIEWLEGECPHVTPDFGNDPGHISTNCYRRCCELCWQEFKEAGH